jgi:hypothetical protein
MSIKQQLEINDLRERVENVERKMNRLNQEPRTVAGVPDIAAKPEPKKKLKKASADNLKV